MNGPGGQIRMWCNGGGTLGADWNSSIVAPFTVELNDQGHEAPEVSPWRLNLITNYTFDRGPMKGVFVGGAGLQPPETATTLRFEDDLHIQDGPHAETAEQLGGFFIIDVPDLDAALEWAARAPRIPGRIVEVRPNLHPLT